MRHTAAGLLLLLLALPLGARAEDEFDRSGFYVGGSGVYAFNIFEDEVEDAIGVPVDVDESFGASGRAGYRAFSWLAIEGQYEWVDGFDLEAFGFDLGRLESHAITLNTKWIVPFWRIQPYLLLGGGWSIFRFDDDTGLLGDQNEDGFAGRGGAGLDLYLTRNLLLNAEATVLLSTAEFDTIAGDIDNVFYIAASLGLQWRF